MLTLLYAAAMSGSGAVVSGAADDAESEPVCTLSLEV